MEREEIEKILSDAGFHPTKGAPSDVIDWQRYKPYNRIILWPIDFPTITRQDLEYLMDTPPEKRDRGRVSKIYFLGVRSE